MLLLVALFAGSSLYGGSAPVSRAHAPPTSAPAESLAAILTAPLAPVTEPATDVPLPGSAVLGPASNASVPILVTLSYSNQSLLNETLGALSDPASPAYHQYLTAAEFDREFSPSPAAYSDALSYFESFGVSGLTTYSNRVSIGFDAAAPTVARIFHTSLDDYDYDGVTYFAPAAPTSLPAPIAASVAQVEGLSSYSDHFLTKELELTPVHAQGPSLSAPLASSGVSGYLAPPVVDGIQFEYAADFQAAYDELSLFSQYGYPTNATVATLLWGGEYTYSPTSTPYGPLTTDQYVGGFDPNDVDEFFNETLPAGEPHPVAEGVPIGGAVAPGPLASWDSTGAVVENTLDLEMVGSSAPGAHLYNIYGPSPTTVNLDEALAYALNPNASFSGLDNVSVITNSWGGTDSNDSSWFESLEEAQARGITVVAASGDSDDSELSSKYVGSPVEFPSAMAYDGFGVVAVGGTTVVLNSTSLEIDRQVAWSDLAPAGGGGPIGSTGGVSTVFPEPSWQVASPEANSVIRDAGLGAGRGVPDLAALANDTLFTYTLNGTQYPATDATYGGEFYYVQGTSISAPLTAGLIATIDHTLVSAGNRPLGFLDPALYSVADEEFAAVPGEVSPIGAFDSSYNSILPALPTADVVSGSNAEYPAGTGYDLVTGWGSLDAYNFTMYVLRSSSQGVIGRLSGVQDWVNLTGLAVTSTGSSGDFNASTQQNLFLANSLGAPVYWVQNVVYIRGAPGDWSMNFTGWVVWPFWALYPSETIYEYNVPLTGLVESTPLDFDFETELTNTSSPTETPTIVFSFGVAGTHALSLPVPGAAYILGGLNDTYSWQGTTYTNGPYPGGSSAEGFLSPQFALVGGPSDGLGAYGPATAGTIQATIEPYGSSSFFPAGTETLPLSATQTGEEAEDVGYTQTAGNAWSIGYDSGSETQGIVMFELARLVSDEYTVQFNETGAPASATWWVNVTGAPSLTASAATGQLSLTLANGSYAWTASVNVAHASLLPGSGTVVVAGSTEFVDLKFVEENDTVTFSESDLPGGAHWTVSISSSKAVSGTTPDLLARLPYGNYSFTVSGPNTTWAATPARGTFEIDADPASVTVTFREVVYAVEFVPTFSGTGPVAWSVTIAGTYVNGTSGNGSLELANGSYSFRVSVPSGYSVRPVNGSVALDGRPSEVNFTITRAVGSTSLSPFELLALLGVVVLIVGVVVALAARRRSRPPPTPPPGVYPR